MNSPLFRKGGLQNDSKNKTTNYPLGDESNIYGYAYYALYCYDLGKDEEFLKMLEIAVERNPEESITALHHIFPEGMKPTEYIDYILKNNKDLLF